MALSQLDSSAFDRKIKTKGYDVIGVNIILRKLMRFLRIKGIYSVHPILLKPSENMLAAYGHKFGEYSGYVQILRLFECHLAGC